MKTAQVLAVSCNRREFELGQVRNFLRGNGFELSSDDWITDKDADLILLSTCGFTQAAEEFGFATLHRIQREKKPGAQVVLCGCIPEIDPERVKAEFDGPDISPQTYSRLDGIISATKPFDSFKRPNLLRRRSLKSDLKDDLSKGMEMVRRFDGSFSGLRDLSRRLGNRATRRLIRQKYANIDSVKTFYIQIQEGCSMECSYCSIKKAIGKLRSRPLDAVISEFKSGLDSGYRQFRLVGDNAGSYGLDIGSSLAALLKRIAGLEGEFKLDLTDINPAYIPAISDVVVELASAGRVARLYVPIQSGSPRILKLMKRPSDMSQLKAALKRIRAAVPSGQAFLMGTSIIVGFPSETPEEVQQTIDFCKEVQFDWVWCHGFSARPETPAASMSIHIGAEEILERARLVKKELKAQSLVTNADDGADIGGFSPVPSVESPVSGNERR